MKQDYYPVRILYRTKTGTRTTYGYYDKIKKFKDKGTFLGAWNVSTGKPISFN